ncbi:anthrone oxygenase family protein [Planomonospora algeriensis]
MASISVPSSPSAVPSAAPPAGAGVMAARTALVVALLAMGAIAGFFYAYEVSVTRGLADVGEDTYVLSMQAINATVRNIPFALSFFGAPVFAAVALAAALAVAGRRSASVWLVAAALAVYLAGGLGVTLLVNVPLNEDLAAVAATVPDLAAVRTRYESEWNAWNTVRTLASGAAFALLAAAAVLFPRTR